MERSYKILLGFFVVSFLTSSVFAGFNFSHRFSTLKLDSAKFLLSTSMSNVAGTVEEGEDGNISGTGDITFDNGVLERGTWRSLIISGKHDPDGDYKSVLDGDDTFRSEGGKIKHSMRIQSGNNRIEGQIFFDDTKSTTGGIALDAAASLTVAIQSNLNTNIEFIGSPTALADTGAIVELDSDLHFADDCCFIGTGTVDLRRNSLYIGGKNDLFLTHTINWENASDINLGSKTILNGTWKFQGINNVLNGHGNILDLTQRGTIWIESASTLELTDIVVKGIGIDKGWFHFENDTAQINFSNVTIELENRFRTSIGGIYVDGPSTVITKNYDWTFDQSGSLTVDGVTLWKDPAGYAQDDARGNILFTDNNFTNGKYLSYIFSGTIQDISQSDIYDLVIDNSQAIVSLEAVDLTGLQEQLNTIDHGPNNVHFVDNIVTMSFNIYLGTFPGNNHRMYVENPGYTTTVDGSQLYIHFARETTDWMIDVADNTKLVFENVVLKDFQPKYIKLGSDSSVIFGDGTIVELATTASMPNFASSVMTMSFDGNVIINGYGHEFDLSTAPKYALDINPLDPTTSATLTLENVRLAGLGSYEYNLRSLHRFGTVQYRNCDLMLTSDYTYSEGFLNIYQDVNLKGMDHKFTYQTPRQGKVQADSIFLIDRDVTFSYDAGNHDMPLAGGPTRFELDAAGVLYLNGCTLYSTKTGLQLDQGTLIIDDKVTLTSEAQNSGEAITFDESALDVKVLGGATMDVFGRLKVK